MIRRFCDQCGIELTADNVDRVHDRLIAESGCVKVEVHVAINGTWNGGQACEACVVRAVCGDLPTPPAPVADVEPQPDAPTARAVSEALHNAGVNTTVSASDNGLLIRVSNRYTPRLLDVLDPASAPDVLRMPADEDQS